MLPSFTVQFRRFPPPPPPPLLHPFLWLAHFLRGFKTAELENVSAVFRDTQAGMTEEQARLVSVMHHH